MQVASVFDVEKNSLDTCVSIRQLVLYILISYIFNFHHKNKNLIINICKLKFLIPKLNQSQINIYIYI